MKTKETFRELPVTKLFNRHSPAAFSLCLGSLLALVSQPSFLQADTINTDEWQIEADKVLRFDTPQSVIAEGNVILTKIRTLPPKRETGLVNTSDWSVLLEENPATPVEDVAAQDVLIDAEPRIKTEMTIKADWIAYDVEQNSIKAKGNVSIANDTDQLTANEGVLDLNKETGIFKEALILRDSMDLHLEGETIEKTGVNTYRITNGWVVTCKVPEENTPPWSFAASETNVTQGEYAFLKHATFRIKDVPVLYTPWLMLPVGNKRQTGVLFPEVSSSDRNGFGFNLPIFINVSDSSDLTLYPEYYANRGFMPGMEFRYVLGTQDKGSLMASYIYDDLSDPSETDYWNDTGYTHTNQDRYWVRGKIDQDFDNDITTRIDLDIVSDRDYLTEFNGGVTGFDESNQKFSEVFGRGFQNKTSDQRQNSVKLLKTWDGMALEGVFLGINDVRPDPVPFINPETGLTETITNPGALWKLPSIDFTGSLPMGETSLTLDWDTDYVNYYREDGVGGHRLDLYPRLSAPIPLSPYLEARAEAGVRETLYSVQTFGDGEWDKGDNPNRLLGDFHTEVGTTLLRSFGLNADNTSGFTHNLRPFIQYDFLSDTDQEDLPSFDSVDYIGEQNAITYGVDNFFDLFGNDTDREYGYLKISQSYDFRSEASDTPFTPVNVKLRWNPLTQGWVIYKTNIDVYGDGFTSHSVETAYENSRGDYFNLDYRYGNDGDTQQINFSARAQLFDTIFAAYAIEHSISESEIISQNISLMYQPACWSVELTSRYTPGDHSLMLMFNLANIGSPINLRL
ncbi:LPS-assembly protein LptD [Desulfocapsa sulfexigens]|uniref:LPS-assembly protein LptD n=1 Tax=Desulfocapsa sulfexigens TaxID=65555 RepID=UPI000348EDBF|nr:LPS assembly protein LptD [Desulfocapsa sulfexigens]